MTRGLAQAIANRTHTEVTQSTHPSPKPSFALTEHTQSDSPQHPWVPLAPRLDEQDSAPTTPPTRPKRARSMTPQRTRAAKGLKDTSQFWHPGNRAPRKPSRTHNAFSGHVQLG